MLHVFRWSVLIAFLSCIGCDSRPANVAVQGIVSYQGKETAWGKIDFIPTENTAGASACSPITNGLYEIPEKWGLLPDGVYEVRIVAFQKTGRLDQSRTEIGSTPGETASNYIPANYNTQSTLTIRVADLPNKNKIDFHLPINE